MPRLDPLRSGIARMRYVCHVSSDYGSVEWQAVGREHSIALVAEEVGRIRERGHTVQKATMTSDQGKTVDILALLDD